MYILLTRKINNLFFLFLTIALSLMTGFAAYEPLLGMVFQSVSSAIIHDLTPIPFQLPPLFFHSKDCEHYACLQEEGNVQNGY